MVIFFFYMQQLISFLNHTSPKQEVERLPLSELNREECNMLMLKKGFYKKTKKDEEVPEQYRDGPYKERVEL